MKDTGQGIFELLKNENFIQWVQHPSVDTMHYWEKWISNHPERKKDVTAARKLILSSKLKRDQKLPTEVYDRILERIVDHSSTNKHKIGLSSNRLRIWKYAVAASVALIVFFSTYYNNSKEKLSHEPVALKEKSTVYGQKITTKLPDGSIVSLNSGTTISFPESFDGDVREIELVSGEAFFDIKRNPKKPFIVKVNNDRVRVLGTSFNIRAYPEESVTQVAVATGTVSYKVISGDEVILKPNQLATYDMTLGEVTTSMVDPMYSFGWRTKVLYFKEASLNQIILKLERWYGYEIKLEEGFIRSGTYSGEFQNQRLEEVLKGLSFIYEFHYEIIMDRNEVTISDVEPKP